MSLPNDARNHKIKAIALALSFGAQLVHAGESNSLLTMALEDLMQLEITNISKRTQALSETAASIFIITEQDIANSTATSLPDLLRIVPGIEVAQIDANKWAISARGFNSRLSSKVMVFVDGRSVYVPTYATVFWESEDLILENIARIEIIRGPGATIWGANAVNGVISITTKSSKSSTGTKVSVNSGTLNRKLLTASYGEELSPSTSFRIDTLIRENTGFKAVTGGPADDNWESYRFDLRLDSSLGPQDEISIQASRSVQDINQRLDILRSIEGDTYNLPDQIDQKGANLSARWIHTFDSGSTLTSQAYYDLRERSETYIAENIEVIDLDVYWNNNDFINHNLTIGAGARLIKHDTDSSDHFWMTPDDETLEIYNISVQDDFRVLPSTILGFGLKLENNIFTGTEYQASLSLNQALNEQQNIWLSYSRAVRTPSRAERDGTTLVGSLNPGELQGVPFPVYLQVTPGETKFDIEVLKSLEAGWRFNPSSKLSIDAASFYNHYSGLRNLGMGSFSCSPDPFCMSADTKIIQDLYVINSDTAVTWGLEAYANWEVAPTLSTQIGYTYFEIDYVSNATFNYDESGLSPIRNEPMYKFTLQADWLISQNKTLNLSLRHISSPGIFDIDKYSVFDLKYTHRVNENFSFSIAGRNLGDGKSHQEFYEDIVTSPATFVERSAYLSLRWSW